MRVSYGGHREAMPSRRASSPRGSIGYLVGRKRPFISGPVRCWAHFGRDLDAHNSDLGVVDSMLLPSHGPDKGQPRRSLLNAGTPGRLGSHPQGNPFRGLMPLATGVKHSVAFWARGAET